MTPIPIHPEPPAPIEISAPMLAFFEPFPGDLVAGCTLEPDPPGWQTVVTEGAVGDVMVEIGPKGPSPGDPFHPSYTFAQRVGWGRSDDVGYKPSLPSARHRDGRLELWGQGWSCAWTGRGCSPGQNPSIDWPDQPFASFPADPETCLAASEAVRRGLIVVLGDEVVALATPSGQPGSASYTEVARFLLPSAPRGVVSDGSLDEPADAVVIRMKDGGQAMMLWTEERPKFAVLGPLDGPVRFVDDRILATRDAVYGLSEDLGVAWGHKGPVISLLRLDDALWWITGAQTTEIRRIDPTSGAIRSVWTIADGAPLYGELRALSPPPRTAGQILGARVWFYMPPETPRP